MARKTAAAILLLALGASSPGWGQEPAPSASAAVVIPTEVPLPAIPEMPSTDVGAPDASFVQDLQTRIDELLETKADGPLDEVDFGFLLTDASDGHVPAIAARLQELRQQLDGKKAYRRLEKARRKGKRAINKLPKKERPDGDWLVFMLAEEDTEGDAWSDTVGLLGMLRMLEAIGTTPAVRQMVDCVGYFGNLVRVDLQRTVVRRLKDKAVPALLEAKKHDAKKVQKFARVHLEMLGRSIPGESVSTTDPDVLTDVLYALGRIRDLEAARVVLSFANHDRVQVRTAARAGIVAMGDPASWYLKDNYKNLTGSKPPGDWDHKRTAREIFRIHDRSRLTVVFELWDQGKKALEKEDHAAATKAFDGVLARMPLFDERAKMAPAYFGHAESVRKDDAAKALLLFRKALRLDPEADTAKKIEARLALLEAKELIEAGTPDRFLLEKAIELDPDDEEAKTLLASLAEEAEERQAKQKRNLGGLAALVVGVCIAVFVLRKRDPDDEAKPVAVGPPQNHDGSA